VTPAFEAKVVDDDGREVPIGEVGSLMVKGDATAPFTGTSTSKPSE
jgi:non-ribosomal peptide synthetase component E (peptide arylation enzyme)